MKKVLIAVLLALGLMAGLAPAGATPTNAGLTCQVNTDYCTGWTPYYVGSGNQLANYLTFNHTFDPNGNGVWDVTAMQWWTGSSPHAIGYIWHAISYDWAVPHYTVAGAGSYQSRVAFQGHATAETGNVIRWSVCDMFPNPDTTDVSLWVDTASTGHFACYGATQHAWLNGGGYEWLNSTYATTGSGNYGRGYSEARFYMV